MDAGGFDVDGCGLKRCERLTRFTILSLFYLWWKSHLSQHFYHVALGTIGTLEIIQHRQHALYDGRAFLNSDPCNIFVKHPVISALDKHAKKLERMVEVGFMGGPFAGILNKKEKGKNVRRKLLIIRPDEKGVVEWSWSHRLLESLPHEIIQGIHAGVQIRSE